MEVFKPTPAWSQGENFHNLPPVLFVSTTNLSEFAASLNRIGVSYKTSCSVALALRYIPDIQREYYDIAQLQQARGIGDGQKGVARQAAEGRVIDTDTADFVRPGPNRGHLQRDGTVRLWQEQKAHVVHGAVCRAFSGRDRGRRRCGQQVL